MEEDMAKPLNIGMCLTSRIFERHKRWRNQVRFGHFKTFVNFSFHAISKKHRPYRTVILIISPTHKRTEERAPAWGSEFTSKRRRTTGGGPAETAVG
jgi:hypothetical protein